MTESNVETPTHQKSAFRDTYRKFPWVVTGLALFVLWLLLTALSSGLPSAEASDISSVTSTLSTLTYEAAFAVPVSVLVGIVGAAVTLGQMGPPGDSTDRDFIRRLSRLIRFTALFTTAVTMAAAIGAVWDSAQLHAGSPQAIQAAVGAAGAVLTGVIVEAALLLTIVLEIVERYDHTA